MRHMKIAPLVVGLGVLLSASQAAAQCSAPYYTWSSQTVSTAAGLGWAPASDSQYNTFGSNISYVAQGSQLQAVRNVADGGGAAGTVKWTWTDPSGTIGNFPSPVPLKAGGEFIYLVSSDGFLYKINAVDGTVPISPVDTRRSACAAGGSPPDSVVATPTVQLYADSSCAFKNSVDGTSSGCGAATCGAGGPHACNDVVYVITRTGCGDSTSNRVIAYYSNDLTVKWTFNAAFTRKMDFATEGCAIDYATDSLYCGTNNDPSAATPQNSLWAINSITGGYKWAGNAGPIRNRPQLALGKLWVGTYNGNVMTYNPAGSGTNLLPVWSAPIQVPGLITNNIWPEFRSGTGQGNVYLRDSTNNIYVIGPRADTTIGILYQTTGGIYTSMPVVWPGGGKVFVGTSTGYIQQLAQVGLGLQDKALVNNTATVYDATLDVESATDVNRLVVASAGVAGGSGKVTRVCLPLSSTGSGGTATCSIDSQCTGHLVDGSICNPCDPCFCDNIMRDPFPTNTCYHDRTQAPPDGTACNDGLDCTCDATHADSSGNCTSTGANDACRSYVCASDYFKTCPCTNPGDRACAPGSTCCGSSNGGCVNLQTDVHHCGGCGIDCGTGGSCINGQCHQANPCSAPTAAQLASAGVTGATALAFDANGSNCNAYLSTYVTSSVNAIYQVTPSATKVAFNSPAGNFTPLNGVAVTKQGDMAFGAYVNDSTTTFTGGLAWEQSIASPTALQKPVSASVLTGTAPWTEARFDDGPVGPAFDYATYSPGVASSGNAYFGNFTTTGTITKLTYTSGTSWTTSPVTYSNPASERITAIAFERRWNRSKTPRTKDRTLFIAHGTTLSLIDLDTGVQTDVNVNSAFRSAHGENPFTGILSIAVHPLFGDIYLEVRDNQPTPNQYVIDVDDIDLSARNFTDVEDDEHEGTGFPVSFTTQGKLVMTPSMNLMRMVPTINGAPSFTAYGASPP